MRMQFRAGTTARTLLLVVEDRDAAHALLLPHHQHRVLAAEARNEQPEVRQLDELAKVEGGAAAAALIQVVALREQRRLSFDTVHLP